MRVANSLVLDVPIINVMAVLIPIPVLAITALAEVLRSTSLIAVFIHVFVWPLIMQIVRVVLLHVLIRSSGSLVSDRLVLIFPLVVFFDATVGSLP